MDAKGDFAVRCATIKQYIEVIDFYLNKGLRWHLEDDWTGELAASKYFKDYPFVYVQNSDGRLSGYTKHSRYAHDYGISFTEWRNRYLKTTRGNNYGISI